MIAAFKKHIDAQFPELKGDLCLLAISGGRDSVVLAHLLHSCDINFALAHCNFKLRGDASDGDEKFVAQLAAHFKVPFYSTQFETKKQAKQQGVSTQMVARDLRYAWFQKLQEMHKMPFVLTAHHLDDQIETFFINLNRGSGLDGLTGIPARNGSIRRPLLPFSREEITQYALAHNITWREDASNESKDYLRNAIRHDLLPLMNKVLPDFKNKIAHTFTYLNGSKDLVDDALVRFRESVISKDPETTYLPVEFIRAQSNPAAYLYELLKVENPHMPDILDLLNSQTGKFVICGSKMVSRDRENLIISTRQPVTLLEPLQITDFNKTYNYANQCIDFKIVETTNPLSFVKRNANNAKIFLDVANINGPLFVKIWERGDKIEPYGMVGAKLVSDLLIDHKIPRINKEKIVVLTNENKILGVLGIRAGRHHAVTTQTSKIIMISYSI